MNNAIDLKEIVKISIILELFYDLENFGTPLFNEERIGFAKRVLVSFKNSYLQLQKQIKGLKFYDRSCLDYEFKTLFYAVDKIYNMLGNAASEEDELQASIYHSHIRGQHKRIRQTIAEQY